MRGRDKSGKTDPQTDRETVQQRYNCVKRSVVY